MTIIANITLMIAALFALCAMLRWDLMMQQQNGYSNRRYNAWLRQSSELTSVKRLTVLAVLIGCFTTMAQTSWIVVMILALVLIGQGIALLMAKHDKPVNFDKRGKLLFFVALLITVAVIGTTAYLGSRQGRVIASQSAAVIAVMILAVSPLLTMLVNWLLHPFMKRSSDDSEKEKPNT